MEEASQGGMDLVVGACLVERKGLGVVVVEVPLGAFGIHLEAGVQGGGSPLGAVAQNHGLKLLMLI